MGPTSHKSQRGAVPRWVSGALLALGGLALGAGMLYVVLLGGSAPEGLPPTERPGLVYQLSGIFKLGNISDFLWYGLAAMTVGSAAGVAFSRNIIYSAFSLLGTFLGVAAMYIYLAAPFIAVTQILIYIGGVLVLILFAVMLTSHIRDVKISNSSLPPGAGLAGLAGMLVLLAYVGAATPWTQVAKTVMVDQSTELGDAFLSTYLLPFEVASVVLLATLIGAVVIARDERGRGATGKPGEES
jgi:NADH-quinone oxidoreductase subunit J